MEQAKFEALIAEAVRDADLYPEDIPAINLYLDQITSLMADKLAEASPRYRDHILTKTMINNYSKDGLISPIKGKKYTREQILQMLLVYSLKNTLSIGEIKRILQNVYKLPEYTPEMPEAVYREYLDIKELERREIADMVSEFAARCELELDDSSDYLTFILGLSSMSFYLKNIAQALLEDRYPDLEVERAREEAEKKEELKRQKEAEARAADAKKAQEQAKKAEEKRRREVQKLLDKVAKKSDAEGI